VKFLQISLYFPTHIEHKKLINPALTCTTPVGECDSFLASKDKQIPGMDLTATRFGISNMTTMFTADSLADTKGKVGHFTR
jgi:hypothetical protein